NKSSAAEPRADRARIRLAQRGSALSIAPSRRQGSSAMTIDPANAGSSGLVDRIKSILLKPQAEWDRIAGEPAEVNKLYIGYVLPLAALAAVAGFIGTSLIGTTVFGVSYRMPLATGVVMAVLQVIAAMVGIF